MKEDSATLKLTVLAKSAAQFLAPNSLQFNENEFQRSSKEAQDAAREAAKLIKPGCCKGFREALAKARQEDQLDIFTIGSASMTDFERIQRVQPGILSRVPLPVVNYTLTPHKRSWRAYIPEMVQFAQNVQNNRTKWPLLAPEVFPKVHELMTNLPPTSLTVKSKVQALGYVIVFLVLLRRGITVKKVLLRAVEVLMLRYVAHHVMLHFQTTPTFEQAAQQAGAIPSGGLCVLVIDQQVDFHPGGSLAIPTANEDAARIAAFIVKHTDKLQQVVLTLDSHQRYHIAHGIFWENAAGGSPTPFTLITAEEVAAGVWKPRDSSLKEYVLEYTKALEASGKFALCIWPEHCLMGTPGHNIVPDVLAAALEWTKKSLKLVQYVMKGSNSFTEHYSALKAEFELPYDPATSLNQELVDSLKLADKVVICGEAISHCVNYTVRDLVAAWPKERLSDLVILTDCASPVPGFEQAGEQFLVDMAAEGLTLTTSDKFTS
ncbi:hypothetical protein JM18_000714 [Phytophthora kernoviae]|uniref:Isochorismatase-like domain-containing protein n=2 Tax=Phytophthora kernoviae TaxID=325452 RepID=A0A921VFI4_9STRA|nr:hypothetical protein G195_003788 [Phytophthora kernoviae 00238/432]KAG2532290.1 hypothetical protein JM18_000714 [Phytophthora kernoviae]